MQTKCKCESCHYEKEFKELESEYIDLSKKHEELLKQWNKVAMVAMETFKDSWEHVDDSKIITCISKLADIRDMFLGNK